MVNGMRRGEVVIIEFKACDLNPSKISVILNTIRHVSVIHYYTQSLHWLGRGA